MAVISNIPHKRATNSPYLSPSDDTCGSSLVKALHPHGRLICNLKWIWMLCKYTLGWDVSWGKMNAKYRGSEFEIWASDTRKASFITVAMFDDLPNRISLDWYFGAHLRRLNVVRVALTIPSNSCDNHDDKIIHLSSGRPEVKLYTWSASCRSRTCADNLLVCCHRNKKWTKMTAVTVIGATMAWETTGALKRSFLSIVPFAIFAPFSTCKSLS